MRHLTLIILVVFGFLLFSCNEESENSNTTNQMTGKDTVKTEIIPDTNGGETTTVVEGDPEIMKYLVGKWKYDHSVLEMDGESMNMVSADNWVMHYKSDGTFEESQTMVEGGETYTSKDTYKLEGKTLKRTGLIAVDILEINEKEMTILSIGTKMVFKKVK
jgi:hypothetical protein